jgi:predicted DCC family thiol-disulfide oxidoreductase YuxK
MKGKPEGWVLYDGACGLCSRWVPLWENTLKRRGFLIVLLRSDQVAEKLHLSDKELSSDFRLLLADGEQLAVAAPARRRGRPSRGAPCARAPL